MIRSLRSKTSDKTCPPGTGFFIGGRFFAGLWEDFLREMGGGDGLEQGILIWLKMMISVYLKGMLDVWNPAKYTEKGSNGNLGIPTAST